VSHLVQAVLTLIFLLRATIAFVFCVFALFILLKNWNNFVRGIRENRFYSPIFMLATISVGLAWLVAPSQFKTALQYLSLAIFLMDTGGAMAYALFCVFLLRMVLTWILERLRFKR
jgi:hypothetical protein